MAEIADRRQFQIHPVLAWTALTEDPLKGLMLARKAGTILAWDERNQVKVRTAEPTRVTCHPPHTIQ
jgi:hypothetical protein